MTRQVQSYIHHNHIRNHDQKLLPLSSSHVQHKWQPQPAYPSHRRLVDALLLLRSGFSIRVQIHGHKIGVGCRRAGPE